MLASGNFLKKESKIKQILAYIQRLEITSGANEVNVEDIIARMNPDFPYLLHFFLKEISFTRKNLPSTQAVKETHSEILEGETQFSIFFNFFSFA